MSKKNLCTLSNHIDKKIKLSDLYAKISPPTKLIDHLLETGYMAEALILHGRAHNLVKRLSEEYDIGFLELSESICFLVASHDIGKAHPSFISNLYSKASDETIIKLAENLKAKKVINDSVIDDFRHERFSRDILNSFFDNKGLYNCSIFADIIAFHHQGKEASNFSKKVKSPGEEWEQIHSTILETIEEKWQFSSKLNNVNNEINGLLYSILSILVVSDWIVSGSHWRELVENNPFLLREELAKRFIEENELSFISLDERFGNIEWSDVFKFSQNELQAKVIERAKSRPKLMIIEYPCGGGKTEAALAASRIMGYNKSGIYIATPTMSTAKSMTVRMNEIAKTINLGINIPEFDSSSFWSDDDMFKIPEELWTSRTRHKMLYPFAVGTVDQIIKSVISFRYSIINLMGLSDKVLIIDEVHAYDSYMLTELEKLLEWCHFLDVPVILLSATLPTITKEKLLIAAGCSENKVVKSNAYPLITTFDEINGVIATPINCEGKSIPIKILETDNIDKTFDELVKNNDIGCSAFVRETVDSAWNLYENNLSDSTSLFQGRDTIEHKEKKTLDLINKLGKDRKNRPLQYNLIATSIIEQSLDIDVDRMFTTIAPIDLIIQRAGRVHRHTDKGTFREHNTIDFPLTIIIPNVEEYPKIYDKEIIEKTIEVIKNRNSIHTVNDARYLIDSVYSSPEDIDRLSSILKAGSHLFNSPFDNDLVINVGSQYAKFKPAEASTRETTYETVNIGILDKILINPTYDDFKKIMRSNVVSIPKYKLDNIKANGLNIDSRILKDVFLYLSRDLEKENIQLTKDGLKWELD